MLHIQIKAKSGLHAGALWRFDQTFLTMGAHPQADVFLCDPDIPDNLITLRKMGRRYEIESINSEARLTSPDMKKVEATLFPSQSLMLDFRHVQLELEVLNASYGLATSVRDKAARNLYRAVQFLRSLGARAIVAFLFVISLLITTTVLFFGTAGVVKSQASVPNKLEQAKKRSDVIPVKARMAMNIEQEFNSLAQRMSFTSMNVNVENDEVEIDVELSRAQAIEFERLLSQVTRDYGNEVEIRASLRLSSEQLAIDEIQVEQLVLGVKPVLVLRDGERLYIGGNYNGVKLVGIQSDKVVFQGSTLYEVML